MELKIARTQIYLELTGKTLPMYTTESFDDLYNELHNSKSTNIILEVARTKDDRLWYPSCGEKPTWVAASLSTDSIKNFVEINEPRVSVDYGEPC
ncbi:hypothetical protein [uncultured Lactobacillus sp.]|uniref:hypothetical protein n=1 Tax=uncultured Lactobacillus sp. TaxID=153152 RepID=UPI002624B6A9|nr:hypothetical protein [uncultured Lactobacillus sp.]